jgi:hypothetical protein
MCREAEAHDAIKRDEEEAAEAEKKGAAALVEAREALQAQEEHQKQVGAVCSQPQLLQADLRGARAAGHRAQNVHGTIVCHILPKRIHVTSYVLFFGRAKAVDNMLELVRESICP